MGPIGCSETSVRNYNYTLRNSPEECSPYRLRGQSLKINMHTYFDVFLTVHHSIDFSKYQLSAQFF